MNALIRYSMVALMCLGAASAAMGQAENQPQPADQPAPEAPPPAAEEPLKIVVTNIEGRKALYRATPEAPWQPMEVGMELAVGGEIRTALATVVTLQLGPNIEVVLDKAVSAAVADLAVRDGQVLAARVMKKFGRIKFNVQKTGEFRNDVRIQTPTHSLAVKGTQGSEWSYAGDGQIINAEGVFIVTNNNPFVGPLTFYNGDEGDQNTDPLDYNNKDIDNNQNVGGGNSTNNQDNYTGGNNDQLDILAGNDSNMQNMMMLDDRMSSSGDGGENQGGDQ